MGWARANILFDKAKEMPEPRSPMEMLFLLVWKMRQDIDFQKSRVIVQSMLSQKGSDSETIKKAYEDLREAFFPFDRNQRSDDIKKMRAKLMKEIGKGPLSVVPQVDMGRKKIASKLVMGQQSLATRERLEKQGKLMSVDAFQKAKNRPRNAF